MTSTTSQSNRAGADPAVDKRDELFGRLIVLAYALAHSRVTRGLGLHSCDECQAEWLLGETQRHVPGCLVGFVAEVLDRLMEDAAFKRKEGRIAESGRDGDETVVEQARCAVEYGEPWGILGSESLGLATVRTSSGPALFVSSFTSSEMKRLARVVACVNYCAGVPTEVIEKMRPMGMRQAAPGAGVDALLGGKGGAQ